MKKINYLIIMIFFLFGVIGGANATLVDQTNGTILDTTTGLYWWQDLADFSSTTYEGQNTLITNLPGSGWHMASQTEIEGLWLNTGSDIVSVFSPAYITGSTVVYDGRYNRVWEDPEVLYHYHLGIWVVGGTIDKDELPGTNIRDDTRWNGYSAWAVTTTAIPIPGAVWLLGSGLIGIVGIRRKFKK